MNRTLLIALLSLFIIIIVSGQQVSLVDAEKVAKNFYCERMSQHQFSNPEDIIIMDHYIITAQGNELYYVFNIAPTGYVLVSGYLNILPVPAYSLTSFYSSAPQPPQFKAWVKQYADQINFALLTNAEPLTKTKNEWQRLLTNDPSNLLNLKDEKEVSPMLISAWDQGQFYNQLCPVDPAGPAGHCLTGCVATAMGQLCYYFRWPLSGSGSYTYQHPTYGTITANFEETDYKWNEMTNSVTSQNESVAELLFHLGVSVDMDYGPSSSGMWNHKAAYSLRTYFKYSPETQYLYRDSTNLDWDSVIIAHLDQKIPMYYAGWSVPNVNGHAFIVDGYQTEEYFHFNFGWSGSYDGYFYLDNLVPGGNNFNLAQELVINCYPDTLNYSYPYYCNSPDTLKSLNGTITDGSSPTRNYLNNAACSWLISPQTNEDSVSHIGLEIDNFETESGHDFLTIYDGETTSSPILGLYSGFVSPITLNSTGNNVLITFESDDATTAPGWFLSYSSVTPVWCNGLTMLTALTDSLSDGSGSFNYKNGSICMWRIEPPGVLDVTINFLDFNTESDKDLVKIYDAGSNQLLATYSGYYDQVDLPDPVTSPSGKMMVTFSSNMTVTRSGWSAYYISNGVGIGEVDAVENIAVYPNPANDILLIDLNFNTSQNVEIEIYDINGTALLRKTVQSFGKKSTENIDISHLENGIYTLRIMNSRGVLFKKMVKMK